MEATGIRKRWIVGAVALVALLVLLLAWPAIKAYRADSLAAQARENLASEQWFEALEAARAAQALAPEDLEVARTLARVQQVVQPEQAPAQWRSVYERSGEEADLLAWFDLLAARNQLDALVEVETRLAEDFPDSSEALFRRARYWLSREKTERGVELARLAAERPGVSDEITFFYVQASQLSANEEARTAGMDHLRALAEREDQTGLTAARLLVRAPGLPLDERYAAAEALAHHPLAEREDKLLEIALRRGAKDQSVEELLTEAKKLFELNDPAELVELGRWLNQQGRSEDFAELVTLDQALQRQDLFLVWLDSMAIAGRWDELAEVMKRTSIPIEPFVQKLFRARILFEQGNDRRGDLAWNQAIIGAGEDANRLWYTYEYAKKLRMAPQAREVLERLTRLPGQKRTAYEKLIEDDQRTGNITELRDDLAQMAREYPHDDLVANDLAYTNLLLGENVEESAATAQGLLDQSERPLLANLMTLALADYRAGRVQQAADRLYPLPIVWDNVRPGWQAVYGAILAAAGHHYESQDITKDLDLNQVLPAERDLLREARQAASTP